ncbi:hypothetical protein CROQUDRAFT_657067 [Cronartium quercuum f. sp. fusiforme G11]|uniref:Acetoacetate decarboxylase n=1 Tax=Cronartium quercuum f. sp. fusiforme G11 TaxID=708437 RepID=A0A9P6NIP0_9BASI|nr:hypothetical protein CROQUDRAFT_657067 [Cronartium quercuum f. sp. fusiforme G11]
MQTSELTPTPSLDQKPKLNSTSHQLVPAPWRLHGEAWWLFLSLTGKLEETISPENDHQSESHPDPHPLGPAHFDTLEAASRESASVPGVFRGGMGTIQIIRYHSSPIGPYDELMIVPGEFALPDELHRGPLPRITRIYVSTLQSVFSGRLNWNVPKHLAQFKFTPATTGELIVRVHALESYTYTKPTKTEGSRIEPIFASTPFFSTIITPYGPPGLRLPMRLSALPGVVTSLGQPPVEEGDISLGLSGTKLWKEVNFDVSGRVGLIKAKGALKDSTGDSRFADGKNFPDFKPYQIGIHWTDQVLDFFEGVNLSPKP